MNIFNLAYDAKAGKKGKRFFYDDVTKTEGAVLCALGSPEYYGIRAMHNAAFEVRIQSAVQSGDFKEVKRIEKIVNCKAIAEYVVVELFGWEVPSEGGLKPLGTITDKVMIEKLIVSECFEPLYSWILGTSQDAKNFRLSHETACKLAGKLLPAGAGGGGEMSAATTEEKR